MIQVVVDASIAIKWVIPEVHQAEALSLIATWNADGVDVVVPGWFACEIANVL
jgi:predicted nucleic acid-binding protein